MPWSRSRPSTTNSGSMAISHRGHRLLRSLRETAFRCPVHRVESESWAMFSMFSSCANCVGLRCNRTQPCEHCIKRGDVTSCSYASTTDLPTPIGEGGSRKTQNTEERLHYLGRLMAKAIELHQDQSQITVRNIASLITRHH